LSLKLNAQKNESEPLVGSLYFLSGDTLLFKKVHAEKSFISGFQKSKITDKWVVKSYPSEELLYFKHKSDKFYFYNYKPSEGRFVSNQEMEQYTFGKKDALYGANNKKTFLFSTLFGIAMGLFDTSFDFYEKNYGWGIQKSYKGFFKADAGYITLSTPFLTTFLVKTKKLNFIDRRKMVEQDVLEESYNHGYESVIHAKNSKSVTRGSLLGVGLIIAVKFIWFSDE
jgi:hypothetical protein